MDYASRTSAVEKVVNDMRKRDSLLTLRGWRDEVYTIAASYNSPPLFAMERAATSAFGVRVYGAHVNGYVVDENDNYFLWIGQRSKTKQTFPGMYDNLAAGGIGNGLSPTETMRKECEEEAGIPENLLKNLKSVGAVSYCYEDENGVHWEGEFIYDLKLPKSFIPKAADNEMERFQLLSISKVKELVIADNFKPNCALITLDFLMRHGFITPDQEPDYFFILENMHKSGL
ncbi:unnamed protein product [Didymodactylos carnosus]|uniref:Nudix hydrolase domain-containing protein n=1 Tax=Didymodactylos carnosus TaxID=1234261 RepID=A0A815CBY0_9BILA|nr:unnamed protein product [Didymodactylos carnosus]CAF1283114.1 unnamed protein product [Didymodactylos carnosus]CAF3908648.1 unnamed protein product [Didymodactylos carnosus]CAF4080358.1 unnamed protein product [Didymodactylos carnosus]